MTGEPQGRTILFVHPSDELYGADRCLLELVRGLPSGWRAVVVLPADVAYAGALTTELTAAGANVQWVDFAVLRRGMLRPGDWPGLLRRLTLGSWQLARLARACGADVVHTNTLAAISGPVAARLARSRHLWHVHEIIADERWWVRWSYRMLALLPGPLVANSIATGRALAGPLRRLRTKTRVVYPGIETVGQPAVRVVSDVVRLAYVGRLSPRKGIGELLEAVALLHRRGVPVNLTVYGTAAPGQAWREERYRQQAGALGVGDIVRFAGFVPDVRDRLASSDVLVIPSQRPEPFGIVVVEGMTAGCAVVVTRNGGGSDEIVEHGVTGLVCGLSPSSIAAAVERFIVERYRSAMLEVYRRMLGDA